MTTWTRFAASGHSGAVTSRRSQLTAAGSAAVVEVVVGVGWGEVARRGPAAHAVADEARISNESTLICITCVLPIETP
jgi:hypothetical protein